MGKTLLFAALFSMAPVYAQHAFAQEKTVTLHVSGMTCGTCPISVRHSAMQMKGVHTAIVNIDTAMATVTYEDSEQSPQAIAQTITKLGYPATITDAKQ
ncbi:periplasmic mercuric ion binding protein [Mariprofundus micogutta]|uniref:Periplasmic mercuric ion binding protein n=1 Tax=Mariprofundus micogutta TaxID=1921010 RepID=A0A1L8CP10_9PROT|nr:cation transporter [Mariprofundus micogutta]GAV20662.1 periplasmic mercuric ion binding protein [Mariprofundus micogutta]